jgi:hypothetical protein
LENDFLIDSEGGINTVAQMGVDALFNTSAACTVELLTATPPLPTMTLLADFLQSIDCTEFEIVGKELLPGTA